MQQGQPTWTRRGGQADDIGTRRTRMISSLRSVVTAFVLAALIPALAAASAVAKDKVKVGFIGPLTGGVSANGIGGRNSADLAVKLRNADANAKYEYELVVLDDECKPNVGVQVATKKAADPSRRSGGRRVRKEGG